MSALPQLPTPVTTTVSTKGQVILPKAIRDLRQWKAGTRLTVEETQDGVLLRQAPLFATTQIDDVYACLAWNGAPKSLEDMDQGVLAEAKRRHAGD
ncbi:AbrB/MazE/SpoVT family DNA-binding domain-containing protein [Asticcacaulis sp. AC402]|uniref:AbrB/MazE/SpoVT family DNA-binding domain-containing protein n=1 Tax=Asticcacaulis sp. AC402 TaxID=1282361 RepID=UPI0003C3EF5B|nr:AbrB/MazE/SpoVT family DNA-binding domain-containing protein [Asticcacaulis sp. AC402]ESQ75027.1 AbrB family transcriptional regulator [Asticcacaulis sp. AC402]